MANDDDEVESPCGYNCDCWIEGIKEGRDRAVKLLQEETAKWPQNKHAQEWLPHAVEVLESEVTKG